MAEASPTPEYKCLLCMKPYNQPRELPCNHTFCCPCLTSYINKEHRTADEDRHYFPCPVCDKPTSPRDVNTDVNTCGTSFPINNLFINPTVKTSDDENCEACQRVGESNPSVVWCTDCAELLCKQCRSFHERIKVSAKHRLVPSKDRGFGDAKVSENCPIHEGRPLDVYCLDHSSMCCGICVSVSHKNCNRIKPIDDVIKTSVTGQPSPDTAWENIKDEATTMLEDDESEMTLLNSKEKEVTVEVARIIQQAKDKLDGLNITFKSELADKCNTLRKQVSDRMNCVKKFRTNSENSNILMTRIDKQGTDRQRFITREKTKHQMSGHYRRMDQNTKKQPNTFDLKLNIGTVIDDILKLTSIAKVDVTSKISSTSRKADSRIGTLLATLMAKPSATTFADSTSASDLVGSPTQGPATVDVWTGSVSCVLSVDRRSLAGEETPFFTGGMFTDNDELLVTDNYNCRLVLFDDKYRYKREYKVKRNPYNVTRGLNIDEILVSIGEGGFMRCTLRNGQLTVTETISCTTYGIAVLGDNILVGIRNNVEVMSSDGKFKKSIQKKCGSVTHLATSTSTSTFYYSDGNDIVCRRLDSDVEDYRYSDPGLSDPRGIGLDRDNNVYVCGSNFGNVYIVSPDGSRGKVLVPSLSSITSPYGIIVHPTKQEFVVTSNMEATSLEVYRFGDNAGVIQ
ncbi:tripartite motif-containing protein 2-like [Mizuhopecten yessoensis]|uniref:tripartite motif-containing protein 2-like n=1 Tax=Mizuhopecten yessoensis TaxID=6573 RepID=UPI000B45F2B2|nr:tripartite motif-containing protein 2-like [Mizuhopecten yessoensis]